MRIRICRWRAKGNGPLKPIWLCDNFLRLIFEAMPCLGQAFPVEHALLQVQCISLEVFQRAMSLEPSASTKCFVQKMGQQIGCGEKVVCSNYKLSRWKNITKLITLIHDEMP